MGKRHSFEKLVEQYYKELAEMDEFDGVDSNEYQRAERRALKRLKKMGWYYPEQAEKFENTLWEEEWKILRVWWLDQI